MIWRNWSTSLARKADKRRWFPEIAWEYDPWAAAGVQKPDGLYGRVFMGHNGAQSYYAGRAFRGSLRV